jgi:hypothetical protein
LKTRRFCSGCRNDCLDGGAKHLQLTHFCYQPLIDAFDGFGRQRTSFSQLLGLLYHLLFAAGNSHWKMRFALELPDLFDRSRSLLDEFNNALVKRIDSLAIRRKLFLGTCLCF